MVRVKDIIARWLGLKGSTNVMVFNFNTKRLMVDTKLCLLPREIQNLELKRFQSSGDIVILWVVGVV